MTNAGDVFFESHSRKFELICLKMCSAFGPSLTHNPPTFSISIASIFQPCGIERSIVEMVGRNV